MSQNSIQKVELLLFIPDEVKAKLLNKKGENKNLKIDVKEQENFDLLR